MRLWITDLEMVNGSPTPAGIPEDVAWAVWPIEDRTPGEGWRVLALADTDLPPTSGRDVGDPFSAEFRNDPLPRAVTNQLADFFGYPRAAVRDKTRADVVRYLTRDNELLAVDRWWAKRLASLPDLDIRWLWEHPDVAWFRSLTPAQRNIIRGLTGEQKQQLRATDFADRRDLVIGWL